MAEKRITYFSFLQAPAADALDETSLEGLNKRLDSLEAAAKDKLVEQVSPGFTLYFTFLTRFPTSPRPKLGGPVQCPTPTGVTSSQKANCSLHLINPLCDEPVFEFRNNPHGNLNAFNVVTQSRV